MHYVNSIVYICKVCPCVRTVDCDASKFGEHISHARPAAWNSLPLDCALQLALLFLRDYSKCTFLILHLSVFTLQAIMFSHLH